MRSKKDLDGWMVPILAIGSHAAMAGMNAFARIGVHHSTAGAVAFVRFAAAALVLWTLWRARGLSIPRGALLRIHLVRGALIAIGATCYFQGMAILPLAQATALTFLAPLLAQPLGMFRLGERPRVRDVRALALGALGVAVASAPAFRQGGLAMDGLAWMAFGIVATACHTVLLRERAGRDGALTSAMVASAIPAVASAPLSLGITLQALPWALAAGILGAAGMTLAAAAAARGTLARTSSLEFAKLPLAALAGWLTAGETPGLAVLAGGTIALAACMAGGGKGAIAPAPSHPAPAAA